MKMKCPPIAGRADDRPKSIIEDSPESDLPGADGIIEPIRLIGVLRTEFNQLPHQPIGFINGQLIKSGNNRMYAIVAIVVNAGRESAVVVIGDADAQISFHVCFLPFCSLLEHLKYIRNIYNCKEAHLGV